MTLNGDALPLDPDDPPLDPGLVIHALQTEVGMLVGRLHTLAAQNVALRVALANARAELAERTKTPA